MKSLEILVVGHSDGKGHSENLAVGPEQQELAIMSILPVGQGNGKFSPPVHSPL